MDKIQVKQGAFGFGYKFSEVPTEWAAQVADAWVSVWVPGDPSTIILQKQCALDNDEYWLMLVEGDIDADPGIYYWELARFEDGVKLDPTFTGEFEILESAGAPEVT